MTVITKKSRFNGTTSLADNSPQLFLGGTTSPSRLGRQNLAGAAMARKNSTRYLEKFAKSLEGKGVVSTTVDTATGTVQRIRKIVGGS